MAITKTSNWVVRNCRFASTEEAVSRALKEIGMSREQAVSLVVANMTGRKMSRADEKASATFIRVLSHYMHPEGMTVLLKSWVPKVDAKDQAYESKIRTATGEPRETSNPVEKALGEANLTLERAKEAVRIHWGPTPSSAASDDSTKFTHYLRKHTSPEKALSIVRQWISEKTVQATRDPRAEANARHFIELLTPIRDEIASAASPRGMIENLMNKVAHDYGLRP